VESVNAASTTNFVGQLLLLAASAQGSGTEADMMHSIPYLHFIT
jgi:hypothetical protein